MPPREVENPTSCAQNWTNHINLKKESIPKCQRINSSREKEEFELKYQSEYETLIYDSDREQSIQKNWGKEYRDSKQIESWAQLLHLCKKSDSLQRLTGTPSYNSVQEVIIACERILQGFKVNGYITTENAGRFETRIQNLARSLLN